MVGKSVVPEVLANKTNFKQWGRRYKPLAGANDARLNVLPERAEAHEDGAPMVAPEASNLAGAATLAQHR